MDNNSELLKVFIDETREHLDKLEPDLLALEQDRQNADLVNGIFRAVHSIKGSAGFFGYKPMNDLSHAMEDVMSKARDGILEPNREIVDALLAGKDKLTLMLNDLDHAGDVDFTQEKKTLLEFIGTVPTTENTAAVPEKTGPAELKMEILRAFSLTDSTLRSAMRGGKMLYQISLALDSEPITKQKAPSEYFKTVLSLGQILAATINIEQIDNLALQSAQEKNIVFVLATVLEPDLVSMGLEIPESDVRKIEQEEFSSFTVEQSSEPETDRNQNALEQEESVEMSVEPVIAKPAVSVMDKDKETIPQKAGELQRSGSGETIRVSVALLDDLMNLAGEMVLGRNQLLRLSGGIAADVTGLPALLQNINLVTSDLQEKVMHTRMQPMENVFSKFPRIIRDMARKLGKEIELRMTGQDVELDKSIIESLSDPLTHLIRNCADHAIEPPEEREQGGKPRIGTVKLAAFHEGGQVHIEISDDGRGINPGKMRDKAVQKELFKLDEAQRLSDREAINLIFMPGFSTAEKVTDVSGRGVGMDVVKTNIEKLGGAVEVESDMNIGTRVRLRLPLTLAIIPSMIVTAGGRRFAIPQVSLEELVRIDDQTKQEKVREMNVIRLRGKLLPIVSLTRMLGIGGADKKEDARYVLVLKHGANRFGLLVNALIGNEEIVVKPLSHYLKKCKFYSGATIMGDGLVAMILDAAGIADFARLKFAEIEKASALLTAGKTTDDTGESQALVLFRNAPAEIFALNLGMISRIEKVKAADLQRLGGREYLKLKDDSLRVIRLHDFMPVSKPEQEPETLYIIIPKLVRHPIGIVATKVDDVVNTKVALNRENMSGTGILGSTMIGGQLTVFLDIYELFEAAEPDLYGWRKSAEILSGKRVLLAEDTAFFRAVESEYLSEFGCLVDVANDGMQAWEKLNHKDYDILITDIEMPGMTGFELAQRVRGSDKLKKLPIIALTALLADRFIEQGKQAGVDAYETKLDKEHLLDTLERILAEKQS